MSPAEQLGFGSCLSQSEHAVGWARLVADFAAVAYPESAEWPEPGADAVLDEIEVRVKDLVSVVSLVNGRLFLRVVAHTEQPTVLDRPTKLMTPSEFLFYYGHPIRKYVAELINPRIKKLKRASEVLLAVSPKAFTVQYLEGNTVDAVAMTVTLHARSSDQLAEWAKRHMFRITDVTEDAP
jgi:hypothetical protein